MRALAMRQTSDRRQACGANHHGGGGLGQPPADAIEASALRARPRWRGATRLAPAASLEAGKLRDQRPDFQKAVMTIVMVTAFWDISGGAFCTFPKIAKGW